MRKQHTMIWKRLLALALALSMVASWLPQRSSAQEVEVVTDNDDLVVEGTNGLGELLSQRLIQAEEEARQAQTQGGCVITDLTVQGNTATVEFVTTEDAMLVGDPSVFPADYCNGRQAGGDQSNAATKAVYGLIVNNADVIKGVFTGHVHSDIRLNIVARTPDGTDTSIPQYINNAAADNFNSGCR